MAWLGLLILGMIAAAVITAIILVNKKQAIVGKLFLVLFIFVLLSGTFVVISQKVNISSAGGVFKGIKLYFLWVGNLFGNLFKITGFAVSQDWGVPDKSNNNIKIAINNSNLNNSYTNSTR